MWLIIPVIYQHVDKVHKTYSDEFNKRGLAFIKVDTAWTTRLSTNNQHPIGISDLCTGSH